MTTTTIRRRMTMAAQTADDDEDGGGEEEERTGRVQPVAYSELTVDILNSAVRRWKSQPPRDDGATGGDHYRSATDVVVAYDVPESFFDSELRMCHGFKHVRFSLLMEDDRRGTLCITKVPGDPHGIGQSEAGRQVANCVGGINKFLKGAGSSERLRALDTSKTSFQNGSIQTAREPDVSVRLSSTNEPLIIVEIEVEHRSTVGLFELAHEYFGGKPELVAFVGIKFHEKRVDDTFSAVALVFTRLRQGNNVQQFQLQEAISFGTAEFDFSRNMPQWSLQTGHHHHHHLYSNPPLDELDDCPWRANSTSTTSTATATATSSSISTSTATSSSTSATATGNSSSNADLSNQGIISFPLDAMVDIRQHFGDTVARKFAEVGEQMVPGIHIDLWPVLCLVNAYL